MRLRPLAALVVVCGGAALLTSCAYYNTFYLAKKYYARGSAGLPYAVEKPSQQASNEYRRSIDLSKKLLAQYPNSKWVDDAYLLWARALLGRDDPLQTVNMLETFNQRFPESPLRNEARFYLGVGYRQARRHAPALAALDTFVARAPRHELIPFAHLERSFVLSALDRPREAADAATIIIERFPKSRLQHQAYTARAEARLASQQYRLARDDFRVLGSRSRTDEERLGYLLREADCLEAAREYDQELALLTEALGYEIEPARPDTGTVRTPQQLRPGMDRFGRILMRIGTVHLLAGRFDEALASYQRIVEVYARTALAAEAQYRIGYAFETAGDDFERARAEYERVREHTGATGFAIQAQQRSQNLARIEQFRSAAGDSAGMRAEANFVLAEQYLFQLDRPERALEEYRKIAVEYAGTPAAAKAMTAEAWVLGRRMERGAEAESLLWKVVREYPATESQLAARDYLEEAGHLVPASLIRLPEPPAPPPEPPAPPPRTPAPADTVLGPDGGMLGPRGAHPDVLMRFPAEIADSLRRAALPLAPPADTAWARAAGASPDTARATLPDSVRISPPPAPPDTAEAARPDTAGAGASR